METDNHIISNVVLDVDGVLWIGGSPEKDAVSFLDSLDQENIPFCLLTNDCTVSKSDRYRSLTKAGLILKAEQLVTASEVTRDWLKDSGVHNIMYLGAPSALLDLSKDFTICESSPVEAVVVGDLFSHYNRGAIDRASKAICDGATLVAMQRNQHWSDGTDLFVDNGFWVAGFEYVTGKKAVVTGKPDRIAYQSALARLEQTDQATTRTFFISDDIASDLKGAKDIGLVTVYFGLQKSLPTWVDYAVSDFKSLLSILVGDDSD